ncbi:MAG TPA: hypothetical protein V6C57_23030 [Coleofasciculaceae cyanobacterium]
MFRLIRVNLAQSSKVWLVGVLLAAAPLAFVSLPERGEAHEVQISGNVGGTMHIEPNDTPQAGAASLTWFALNRRGGQPIRLADCQCTLSVYAQPRRPGDSPIQQPTLSASDVEGRSSVPSAKITFPRAGAYDLVLRGQPAAAGSFSAFELKFSVTVAQ